MARKIRTINILERDAVSTSGGSKDSAKKKNVLSIESWHWIALLGVSIAVAMLINLLAVLIFNNISIGFVWKEIIILLFSLLILVIIGSISEKGKIGVTVLLVVLFISFVRFVNHDYTKDVKKSSKTENVIYDNTKAKLRILKQDNTYAYNLEANEGSPWLATPDGKKSNLVIHSESYDYTIICSDGTSYKGGKDVLMPPKKKVVFKILAHSKQTVYVTIL